MPFTFSHPAIILGFSKISKSKLSFTGLIVGSLAPDFEYFIFMQMRRTHGHEMDSFFWFNLPICILLAFIYHGIVKVPLTNSLPHFLYRKLSTYKQLDWFEYFKKHWFVFIYSAAIGTFSHILWDSFTHDHGIFGQSPEVILQSFMETDMKVFEVLQWISTIVGGIIVVKFLLKLPDLSNNRQPLLQKFMFWLNAIFIMCFIFIVKPPSNLSDFIAVAIGSTLYGIVGSSLYYLIYEKVYSNRNLQL